MNQNKPFYLLVEETLYIKKMSFLLNKGRGLNIS